MSEEKKKPSGQPRSEPTGPRPGGGDILVLLVGVNKYTHNKVTDLSGCINDLDKVENWLLNDRFTTTFSRKEGDFTSIYSIEEEGYGELKIYRLVDEDATHQNIVDAFRNFLGQATEVDRVWFHFSGHGIEAPTAPEFAKLEKNKDQCLICHDFHIAENGKIKNLLADKELAVLVNEVATKNGLPPHIVVTIDCCHSGGATRDWDLNDPMTNVRQTKIEDVVKTRENESTVPPRELSDYLGGSHYSDANLEIPVAPHLVITACNNLQLAGEGLAPGETATGGFFTSSLIDALKSVNGKISYADLLIRARHDVREKRAAQTPQFEAIGGGKPYTRFLEGTPEGSPDRFEVKLHEGGIWTIGCGAIHGLPTTAKINAIAAGNQPIEVSIISLLNSGEVIAKGTISEVGPQYSYLDGVAEALADKEDQNFFGTLNYLPADSVFVLLKGTEKGIQNFKADWEAFPKMKEMNIHYLTAAKEAVPHITVSIEEDVLSIIHEGKIVDKREDASKILINIVQIVRCQRLLALKNPASKLADKINLSLSIVNKENQIEPLVANFSGEKLNFIAREADKAIIKRARTNKRYYYLLPKVTINGVTDPVYCYLLNIYPHFLIKGDEEKLQVGNGEVDFSFSTRRQTGLSPNENQYFHIFKLIVSEEALDIHQFHQEGISPSTKGYEEDLEPVEPGFKDWCAFNMKVTVVREEFLEDFFKEQDALAFQIINPV